MRNPFRIIRWVFKARRPSRVADMPAVSDNFWLRRGYAALTFFGFIVTPSQEEADRVNRQQCWRLKNHEMIHLRQAQSTHDSWLCFYALYLWHWLRAVHLNRHLKNAAYLLNPFELEAYANEHDPHYLETCGEKGANGWRKYARQKPRQRLADYLSGKRLA